MTLYVFVVIDAPQLLVRFRPHMFRLDPAYPGGSSTRIMGCLA